jgi:hypothetical protein
MTGIIADIEHNRWRHRLVALTYRINDVLRDHGVKTRATPKQTRQLLEFIERGIDPRRAVKVIVLGEVI